VLNIAYVNIPILDANMTKWKSFCVLFVFGFGVIMCALRVRSQ